MSCLFCEIIAKRITSTPIYEDENVYAFLDIKPVNPGHVLVVPKKHSEGFHDADTEALSNLIIITQKISRAVLSGLHVQGFNLEQNNGAVAGQIIPHLHFHIIPRFADDGLRHWPGKEYSSQEEADNVAEKIVSHLQ